VAYGHVVATGARGEAYVVPLCTTVRQIKVFFGTWNVRLPEPLDLLSRMVFDYVTSGQFSKAKQAILTLYYAVKKLRASLQWEQQRVAYWLNHSTARTALLGLDFQKDTNHARREEWLKLSEDWEMFVAEEDQLRSLVEAAEYWQRRWMVSRRAWRY